MNHDESVLAIMKTIRWCLIVAVIVIGLYCINFWLAAVLNISFFSRIGFSDSQAVWGTFGDYVGGLLNPIFAFVNLALLVNISLWVAKNDREKEQRERNTQKVVALYSIRQEAVLRLGVVLDKVHLLALGAVTADAKLAAGKIGIELGVFLSTHDHIFPALKEYNQEPITKCIENMGELIQAYFSAVKNTKFGQPLDRNRADAPKAAMIEELKKWNTLRSELNGILVSYIQVD